MQTLYLTRRNLLTLLAKLDRVKETGDPLESLCTIIKADTQHPKYPCSDVIRITALEDEEYYETSGRKPGRLHPLEEHALSCCRYGQKTKEGTTCPYCKGGQ